MARAIPGSVLLTGPCQLSDLSQELKGILFSFKILSLFDFLNIRYHKHKTTAKLRKKSRDGLNWIRQSSLAEELIYINIYLSLLKIRNTIKIKIMDSFVTTHHLMYSGLKNEVLPPKWWVYGICQLSHLLKAIPTKCHWDHKQVQTLYSSLYWQLPVLFFFKNIFNLIKVYEPNVKGPAYPLIPQRFSFWIS